MARIERLQTSDCANPILDIYFALAGTPIDVDTLEFQVFEQVTAAPTLTQVYPLTGRATVDLSACPTGAKIATGHYVAEWTVPVDEPVGTHVLKWFYKQTPSSPERAFQEEFEVLAIAAPSTVDGYCMVQDIRDEGVPVSMFDDAQVQTAITRASRLVDLFTERWFEPRAMTFLLNGRGTRTAFLGVPIISISSVAVDGLELLADEYYVFNRHLTENLSKPDDRQTPRIELGQPRFGYRVAHFGRLFPYGQLNISVSGVFGYTDYDSSNAQGKTPDIIVHVTKLLVMREMWRMFDQADDRDDAARKKFVTNLKTRDQSVSYANPAFGSFKQVGVGAFTGDPEIDTILARYRRPIDIAAV